MLEGFPTASWTAWLGPPARSTRPAWTTRGLEWLRRQGVTGLDKVRNQVKPIQYQLFDCYVLKGWPMREVTRKMRVTMAQVYFAKIKISGLVRAQIHDLQRKWL